MAVEFRKARRSGVKLMIGLAGPSGSGKTYSALLIAQGIQEVEGGSIFVIDTENRRSEHYADDFDFMIGELDAPFTPARYLEAINDAIGAGAKTIIIDSGSHMHEGEGGVLEMHDEDLAKFVQRDSSSRPDYKKEQAHNMRAWIAPKRELNRVVNRLLQVDVNVIWCFRAQEKMKLVPGKDPVSKGVQPIASDRLSYEMTMRLVFPGEEKGVPDLSAPASKVPEPLKGILIPDAAVKTGLGTRLAEWARGDDSNGGSKQSTARPSNGGETSPRSDRSASPELVAYRKEIGAAQSEDDLNARHEGSENFSKMSESEHDVARQVYSLNRKRLRGTLDIEAFNDEIRDLFAVREPA